MNRCLTDVFKYCDGEPQPTTITEMWSRSRYDADNNKTLPETKNVCTHDPSTCGHQQTCMDSIGAEKLVLLDKALAKEKKPKRGAKSS